MKTQEEKLEEKLEEMAFTEGIDFDFMDWLYFQSDEEKEKYTKHFSKTKMSYFQIMCDEREKLIWEMECEMALEYERKEEEVYVIRQRAQAIERRNNTISIVLN